MRTFGPDASRYWLAAQGRQVARPFNLRWLLPALCGDDLDVWRFVWLLSWPVLAVGTAWWALGTGTTWQVALAAAALLVAPWGAGLAALLAPSPQLLATVGLAYAQLVVATDTVRLYQTAAGPVVCLVAAQVIPPQWLLLAVVCHAVFWRQPVVG